MMRTIISVVAGIAIVSTTELDDCTENDYRLIATMGVLDMANCISVAHAGDWQACMNTLSMTSDCAQHIQQNIDEATCTICGEPCQSPDSQGCRICLGVVAVQQIAVLAPTEDGACGNSDDKLAIEGVSAADVVYDLSITAFPSAASASQNCQSCIAAFSDIIPEDDNCGTLCNGGDADSPGCYDCYNVVMVKAMAYCNHVPWLADVTCTDMDYERLDKMDPAAVKTCIEGAEDDGFVECFTDVDTVNLTEDCAMGLDQQIDFQIADICDTEICLLDNPTAHCLNCRGAVMVQEVFAHASEGAGACGNCQDREALRTVNMDAVIACGSEQASTGATCLAFQAEASELCRDCLQDRTELAIRQCQRHCVDDTAGPDCMECVNIGLMSAAAHCNDHMSGAAAVMGLSLISIIVVTSFSFLA